MWSTWCAGQGKPRALGFTSYGRHWDCSPWFSLSPFARHFWSPFGATGIPVAWELCRALTLSCVVSQGHISPFVSLAAWFACCPLPILHCRAGSFWWSCPRGCEWQILPLSVHAHSWSCASTQGRRLVGQSSFVWKLVQQTSSHESFPYCALWTVWVDG